MIGLRVGIRSGPRKGLATGVSADELGGGEPLNLIGFAGQSNEVGFADIDGVANINAYFGNAYSPVLLKQQDGTNANPPVWTFYANEPVKPRTTSPTLNMGVELSLARYLNRRLSGRWAFSKIGIGSTGLNDHWKKTSSYPTVPPRLFDQMITAHQDAERQLGARMAAFVWIQGEQDATDATDAAAYEANLTAFIADVRLVWPAIPFVIVKLHNSNPGAQKAVVRAAQVAVAAAVPGVTLIDVDALALQGDNLHFTPESYLALGNMIGAAINTALGLSNLLPAFRTEYRGRTINVTDASTSDGGSIAAWEWDWGDGSAHDTTQNASHTYAEDTPRTITLTVTNNVGVIKSITKLVRPVLPTWTIDATSGIGCPANATEWANLIAAHALPFSVPTHLWLLQDLLNQTAAIGGKTLTAGGVPGTQQAVAGWSRLAVGHTGLLTNQTFNNTTMLNINASSTLTCFFGRYTTTAAIRQCLFRGAASGNAMETPAAPSLLMRVRNSAAKESTGNHANDVGMFSLAWNRTATRNFLKSIKEVVAVPFNGAAAGTEIRFTVGAAADATADVQALIAWEWEGVAAEKTELELIQLEEALGWISTIPGFPDL